jgi:small subunit ribosomal protein S18
MSDARRKRKTCNFCADKVQAIDFKDAPRLKKYLTERGKILPRRITGTCALHQRMLTNSIKRCRQLALVGYIIEG